MPLATLGSGETVEIVAAGIMDFALLHESVKKAVTNKRKHILKSALIL